MARKVSERKVRRLQAKYADEFGVDRKYLPYLAAQIKHESNFQTNLGSSAGAQDVAQFMPTTAPSYGVTLGDNRIKDDIRGQVKMMAPLIKKYGIEGALRAYNAGEGNMNAGFAETNAYVDRIKASAGEFEGAPAPSRSPGTPGRVQPGQAPQFNPATTVNDQKGAMLAALLDKRKGMSLLDRFKGQMSSGNFTTTTPASVTPGTSPRYLAGQPGSAPAGGRLAKVKAEADRIDAAGVPYLWGGGHGGKQARGSKVTPLDCSGAVSRVLGINPRVSGQFESWGKAGEGKNITVYANGTHVLMKIGGQFWGTSGSNPGGGAGWIPASAVSKAYLSKFKARHPG